MFHLDITSFYNTNLEPQSTYIHAKWIYPTKGTNILWIWSDLTLKLHVNWILSTSLFIDISSPWDKCVINLYSNSKLWNCWPQIVESCKIGCNNLLVTTWRFWLFFTFQALCKTCGWRQTYRLWKVTTIHTLKYKYDVQFI